MLNRRAASVHAAAAAAAAAALELDAARAALLSPRSKRRLDLQLRRLAAAESRRKREEAIEAAVQRAADDAAAAAADVVQRTLDRTRSELAGASLGQSPPPACPDSCRQPSAGGDGGTEVDTHCSLSSLCIHENIVFDLVVWTVVFYLTNAPWRRSELTRMTTVGGWLPQHASWLAPQRRPVKQIAVLQTHKRFCPHASVLVDSWRHNVGLGVLSGRLVGIGRRALWAGDSLGAAAAHESAKALLYKVDGALQVTL